MGQIKAAAMNFKTPFYVIHKNELDDNYKKLTSALEKHWNNYIIGYSYKTNALPWIIKHFDSLGCYAETVSEDEYELAKLVGVTKNKIIYNGPIKTNCISYFMFGYKQSLLVAYQREDINSIINLLTQSGLQIAQIIILVTIKNYYFYVICIPIFTMLNNLWIWWFTKKMFPAIKCSGKLDALYLKSIKKLVIGSFIQKACGVTRNSLDSVCISAFVGLTITGMYYCLVNSLLCD